MDKVHAMGGTVYHDVTALKWAKKARDSGVDGLICVNRRAGGHAGEASPAALYESLRSLDVPLVCAGGIGSPKQMRETLDLGYAGVQLGTRFIATKECRAHNDYKQAIVNAEAKDIVLTEKISGVPVAVINTPYVKRMGTRAGWAARKLLRHPKGKHYMRMFYSLKSMWQLRRASLEGAGYSDYFQAGKSVDGIESVESAADVVRQFADSLAKDVELQTASEKIHTTATSATLS